MIREHGNWCVWNVIQHVYIGTPYYATTKIFFAYWDHYNWLYLLLWFPGHILYLLRKCSIESYRLWYRIVVLPQKVATTLCFIQEESSGDWQISESGLLKCLWSETWASNNTCIPSFLCYHCLLEISFYHYMFLFFPLQNTVFPLNTNYIFFILPYKKQCVLVLTRLCRNLVCFLLISKYILK
jgi:hypothetical protein